MRNAVQKLSLGKEEKGGSEGREDEDFRKPKRGKDDRSGHGLRCKRYFRGVCLLTEKETLKLGKREY